MSIVIGQKHNTVCVFFRFTLPQSTIHSLHYRNCTKPTRNGNLEDVFEKLIENKTNCRNCTSALYFLSTYNANPLNVEVKIAVFIS